MYSQRKRPTLLALYCWENQYIREQLSLSQMKSEWAFQVQFNKSIFTSSGDVLKENWQFPTFSLERKWSTGLENQSMFKLKIEWLNGKHFSKSIFFVICNLSKEQIKLQALCSWKKGSICLWDSECHPWQMKHKLSLSSSCCFSWSLKTCKRKNAKI